MDDAKALTDKTAAPDVLGVAPVVSAQSVTATYDGASHTVGTFTGSTPTYLLIDNDTVATGSAFTDADYNAHRRVALVGTTVAKDLAGGDGTCIVGKTVAFNGKQFTVVGILTSKGSTGPQDSRRPRHRPGHRRPGHPGRLRRAELRSRSRPPPPTPTTAAQTEVAADPRRPPPRHLVATATTASSPPPRSCPLRPRQARRSPSCSAPSPPSRCSSAASAS